MKYYRLEYDRGDQESAEGKDMDCMISRCLFEALNNQYRCIQTISEIDLQVASTEPDGDVAIRTEIKNVMRCPDGGQVFHVKTMERILKEHRTRQTEKLVRVALAYTAKTVIAKIIRIA